MGNSTPNSIPLHAIVMRRYADGTLGEVLEACRGKSVESILLDERVRDIVERCVGTLTYRERCVVRRRGFLGGEKQTRKRIASDMPGLKPDNVRTIEKKALVKLSHATRLGTFIDA